MRRLSATADRRWAATTKAFKRFATKDDLKRYATKADFVRLEERVIAMQKALDAIVRHHGLVLDDHEVRIGDLERRR